jgi:hypothetical protein
VKCLCIAVCFEYSIADLEYIGHSLSSEGRYSLAEKHDTFFLISVVFVNGNDSSVKPVDWVIMFVYSREQKRRLFNQQRFKRYYDDLSVRFEVIKKSRAL